MRARARAAQPSSVSRQPDRLEEEERVDPQGAALRVSRSHRVSDLRVSRWQSGLLSALQSIFTPESCRSLWLRSSSLRLQEGELRNPDRASQLLSERLQLLRLRSRRSWRSGCSAKGT